MNQTKERIQKVLILFIDIMCSMVAYYLSGYIWLVKYKEFAKELVWEQLNDNIGTIYVAVLAATIVYWGVENFVRRELPAEIKATFIKSIIIGGVMAVYEFLTKRNSQFPRGVFVVTIILSFILMLILRCIFKAIFKNMSNKDRVQRIIAITNRTRAEKSLNKALASADWMRKIVSLIIIDEDMIGKKFEGIPVVARAENMLDYLKTEVVDEVYLDIDYDTRESLKPLVMELEDMGITVHIKLDMLETFNDFDARLGRLGKEPVVTFANNFYDFKGMVVKRVFDICASAFGIVIMLIAMIFVVPAIKLESKGPIFFKQKRVGKNGRYFYIYKFRSMYIDAEERKKELMAQNEMSGLMFKMENDPRITKVGKFLRKTSIDELPQFLNIFMGDMSMVGTRPPTVDEFKQYEGHHKRRLSMKPGLTGMWQAYGRNTVSDFEDIVKMDLDYIDNWSLGLDLKIILKTFQAVFMGR